MENVINRDSEISGLNLSVRAYNCLMRENVRTVGDLLDGYETGGKDWLKSIRNMGPRAANEIEQAIKSLQLTNTKTARRSRTAEALDCILKALKANGVETASDAVLCSAIEAASREIILPCEPHYDYEA